MASELLRLVLGERAAPGAAPAPERFERTLAIAALLVMLVGIVWRFVALDSKLYNNDEATTSVHVSGKTLDDYARAMFDGRRRTRDDVLVFQRPDPAHGPVDVAASLAAEDPQHPPLYYLAQYAWERVAGSSIAARRTPAAVFGALAVIAAVWFAAELWSPLAGLLCGALVAASPFALLYSQEAREYSLWTLLTFVASALLVRAMRAPSLANVVAYAAACVLGCYTDLLFVLVLLAHALAVPLLVRGRRGAALGFIASLVATFAAFAPWLVVAARAYARGVVTNNTYLSVGLPLKLFVLKWIFNIGALFYDLDYLVPKSAVLIVPGLLALGFALWVCARRLRARPELGIAFALAVVTLVALVVPDLAHHEARSTSARYLVPLWAALDALLAVALAIAVRAADRRARAGVAAFLAFAVLAGYGSFAVAQRHESWWIDGSVRPIGPIARAIDAAPEPLLAYRATWGADPVPGGRWDFSVVMIADAVKHDVAIVQYPATGAFALETAPPGTATTFLLDPSEGLRAQLGAAGIALDRVTAGEDGGADTDLANARKSAAALRASHGVDDFSASLWKVRR